MNTNYELGKMLRNYLIKRNLKRKAVALKCGLGENTVYNLELRQHMNTLSLFKLSHGMKHNFFADIAAQLPTDYTTDVKDAKSEQITALQKEVEHLKMENKLMRELIQGRMQ